MALNSFGLECLQGLLWGFGSFAVVLIALVGITRLLREGFHLSDD